MKCKKKQIQNRKTEFALKKYLEQKDRIHSYLINSSLRKNKQQNQLEQRNYSIDPWHSKSNPKFNQKSQNPAKFLNQSFIHEQKLSNEYIEQYVQQSTKNSNIPHFNHKNKIFSFDNTIISNQDGENSPKFQSISSPAKQEMLQCSFKFQEYQRQKAQQLKNVYFSKFDKQGQKNLNISKQKIKTNFIEKNIKYLFQLQNGAYENFQRPHKKKSLQQTKQQLKMNKQKLRQSSKQYYKFIPMKQEKKTINQNQNKNKKILQSQRQTTSFWNMSYLQGTQNKNKKKNNFKLKSKGSQINHYFNYQKIFCKKDKQYQSENGIKKLNSQSQVEKRFAKGILRHTHTKQKTINPQDNNYQKQTNESDKIKKTANKFSRLLKLKNKSKKQILVFESNTINERNKKSKQYQSSHNRIHSLTSRTFSSQCSKNIKNKENKSFIENQNETFLINSPILNQFCLQIERSLHLAHTNRSNSACGSRITTSNSLEKAQAINSLKINHKENMNLKSIFIEGSHCQLNQIHF